MLYALRLSKRPDWKKNWRLRKRNLKGSRTSRRPFLSSLRICEQDINFIIMNQKVLSPGTEFLRSRISKMSMWLRSISFSISYWENIFSDISAHSFHSCYLTSFLTSITSSLSKAKLLQDSLCSYTGLFGTSRLDCANCGLWVKWAPKIGTSRRGVTTILLQKSSEGSLLRLNFSMKGCFKACLQLTRWSGFFLSRAFMKSEVIELSCLSCRSGYSGSDFCMRSMSSTRYSLLNGGRP